MKEGDEIPATCVMDTDSLIFSFKLNLVPFRAIDRIESQYQLILPSKVIDEYKSRSRKWSTYKESESVRSDIDSFLRKKNDTGEVISEDKYCECIKHVKKWYDTAKKQGEFHNLGDGEKHCLALGLYWNRKYKTPVFILTDDFRAIRAGLSCFVFSQRIGLTYSVPEAMISLYLVTRTIRKVNVLGFINDYFDLNKGKKIELKALKVRFKKEILSSCRERNLANCAQSCFA